MKVVEKTLRQPQAARSLVLGTAGHIDHGKTALVLALTGTDTDRLPEEKSRGITIDLGFAALALEDANGGAVDLSLIDVPGHHAFVRNMLAGAGGIDCVMLVIAADEGVKAQTEEHLAICTLLGIRWGLVALTKKDAVSAERLEQARDEVQRFVEHTFLEGAPVVAVSAMTGDGIAELKAELGRMVLRVPERSSEFVTRLPLDRAFSVKGFGTVVTGTLQSGRVEVDDTLQLEPGAVSLRVRGVQVHGRVRSVADAPSRVALNLAGIDVAAVQRGQMLVQTDSLVPTTTVDVEISRLPGTPVLKHRAKVRVHAFTSEALASVLVYDDASDGGRVLARLRLSKPMVLAPGDRFVIRQPSPALTIGGGRVLDARPLPRLRKAKAHAWLKRVRDADAEAQIFARVERRGVHGASMGQLVAETGLRVEGVRSKLEGWIAEGRVVAGGSGGAAEPLLAGGALVEAMESVVAQLERSSTKAMPRAELRSKTRLGEWVLQLALNALVREKRVLAARDQIALPGTAGAAGSAVDRIAAEIERRYAAAGLASPIVSEVETQMGVGPKEIHAAITALVRSKKLVRMGSDNLLVHADAIAGLVKQLRERRGESFDVGRFKTFTGLTRKHAIPLLEYLDGARVTRNSNGVRTVL